MNKGGESLMTRLYKFIRKGARAMGGVTVFDVAKYFLSRVEIQTGSIITHLKLQKLCYYAQAWHLVFDNKPMFEQQFEAWAHGPVCPVLWQEYRDYGWHPIPAGYDYDGEAFTESEIGTLEAVWVTYSQFDAKYLEELTHQETPWITTRGGCPPGEACENVISLAIIKDYYSKLQNG